MHFVLLNQATSNKDKGKSGQILYLSEVTKISRLNTLCVGSLLENINFINLAVVIVVVLGNLLNGNLNMFVIYAYELLIFSPLALKEFSASIINGLIRFSGLIQLVHLMLANGNK